MPRRDDKGNEFKKEGRFLRLTHHLLNSQAWQSLTPQERAVFICVAQLFNGSNNGRIAMSCRRAASGANVSKDTANKALRTLVEKGFLVVTTPSSFGTNSRRATEYEVTCFEMPGRNRPRLSFQDWRPSPKPDKPKKSVVPNQGQRSPTARTVKKSPIDGDGSRPKSGTVSSQSEALASHFEGHL